MLSLLPSIALALAAPSAPGHAISGHAEVVTSPEALPATHERVRVFLGGTIDMGSAPDWQKQMIAALDNENVVILNPRRADWNPAWRPEADEPNFRQQVEWELAALDSADVIVLYLSPGSKSPVSLLEMGLHARSGKLIVLCPQGYWRKGNVDITAAKYGVEQVDDLAALIAATRRRIASLEQR
ncbi:nucleoside 2-deoxyribosyltransferase domain-containing protein [Novosphingobium sp. 1949]|uniref:Nucleoside 2-deoxyribosyltransferase domain-containing protein n=1 Tax=Novosphingobium organovorum TaxID=2930092 RepID=A0ABT0B8Q1_9SPHN|nr:nucleoside 2-deoxyribosyltransferase domain-containing protein [Novosphingobium organovorum]MCJ2181450.1 nucleoside 2-deoxyribosyltransferase domain-containing protein [Novosphingobium organovorum]